MALPRGSVATLLSAAVLFFLTSSAQARVSTFRERFDGGFSEGWLAYPGALPNESLVPFRPDTVYYVSGHAITFTKLDHDGVARLSVQNAPSWSRFGYVSQAILPGTVGEVEARINTLTQGDPVIDGLFDLWLVNSQDHSQFVRVGLFGDQFGTVGSWTYSSSLAPYSTSSPETPEILPPFAFQNNTWYRVRITQAPGANLEVSIWDDAGRTRLVSYSFPHTLADLGSSFQIGFSQWMGGPNLTHSLLSAVDNIQAWLRD
jgi:hypothetical protein